MTGSLRRIGFLVSLLGMFGAASPAHAAGAWTTFLRAFTFNDLIASADTVWCATEEGGLLVFNRASGTFSSFTRAPGSLASNRLTSLTFDRHGRLWIGTRDAGVSRLSPDGTWGLLNGFDGLPTLAVNTVRAQGDTVWIGTPSGIAFYNGDEIRGRLPDGVNPSPFASDDITGIAVRGDSLWLSTGAGVYYGRISAGLVSWTHPTTGLPSGRVDALATDGRDVWALAGQSLWRALAGDQWGLVGGFRNVFRVADDLGAVIASTDSGLFEWSGLAWSAVNRGLASGLVGGDHPERFVFSAASDPADVVFAASSLGLYEQQPDPTPWIQRVPQAPPGNNVQNVAIHGARAYMNTYDEGVGRYDGSTWTEWLPGACSSNCGSTFEDPIFTFGMLVDKQGYLWLGSWGVSVDVMDDAASPAVVQHLWLSTQLEDDRHTWLWSAAADSDGGRWFGMDTPCLDCDQQHDPIGIDYYSPSGRLLANYQTGKGDSAQNMANNQVRSLEYDAAHRTMWVGYAGHGVQSFTIPDDTLQVMLGGVAGSAGALHAFRTIGDAVRLDVFSVIPHSDSIWVFNTSDLRLYTAFGSTNSGIGYPIPAGPAPRGAIHPMDVAVDGTVWLGTANGVRVYHPGGATEDFTAANSPLADDEVRTMHIDRATGVVWIGTARGLNRFDPGYVAPPPPRLASLKVHLYPNPAAIANLIGAPLRIVGNGQVYTGRVYSVDGRMIRRLGGAGNGGVLWDGRNDDGVLVKPGLYFVRVEAGGRAATGRVTLLR